MGLFAHVEREKTVTEDVSVCVADFSSQKMYLTEENNVFDVFHQTNGKHDREQSIYIDIKISYAQFMVQNVSKVYLTSYLIICFKMYFIEE